MEHICKFCKNKIELTYDEKSLLESNDNEDYINGDIDFYEAFPDYEPDDNISISRLELIVNPPEYGGVYLDEAPEKILFKSRFDEMCNDCKNDLLSKIELTIKEWIINHEKA